jgi:hypothetical protein
MRGSTRKRLEFILELIREFDISGVSVPAAVL